MAEILSHSGLIITEYVKRTIEDVAKIQQINGVKIDEFGLKPLIVNANDNDVIRDPNII